MCCLSYSYKLCRFENIEVFDFEVDVYFAVFLTFSIRSVLFLQLLLRAVMPDGIRRLLLGLLDLRPGRYKITVSFLPFLEVAG
jgi:hypothetical protein